MNDPNRGAAPDEIARFNALADRWWDPNGPMRPLHAMNPARVGWILRHVEQALGALGGVRLLDAGCGAGLAAEAFALAGLDVLGIDAAADLIAVARAHRDGDGPRYQTGVAEDLLDGAARFQVVTALEVIEHVPDPASFVRTLAALLEPGGLLFLSTLNRTARSFVTAKLGAEYVLRLLPVGTHDWRAFLTPAELSRLVRAAGAKVVATAGLSPGLSGWRTTRDLGVNFLLMARV